MTFTTSTLAQSLADYLAPIFPGVTFLEDPSQQSESDMPCIFLQVRNADTARRVQAAGGYWERRIGLDLTYLDRYNLPDLEQRYNAVAELLDEAMDSFPYFDGEDTTPILTYERSYTVDLDALHYKFELRVRVAKPEIGIAMQELGQNIDVKE